MGTQGGQATLERVFIDHEALVRSVVRRRVGNSELIDDITGEVWLAVVKAFRNDRESDVTTAWLVTVTKRRLVDHWRRAATERHRKERLLSQPARSSEPCALETLLRADQSLLDSLAPREADILQRRYIEGWCVADIATWLGISYRAAESRLARARTALRTQLSQTNGGGYALH